MAEAMKFTTNVIVNSARPAAMSVDNAKSDASGARNAMWADTLLPPASSTCGVNSKRGEMIISTAMVSPRARPRPSIVPPMMPPRPKGNATTRIIPHRVLPSAYAPSRSPGGTWENAGETYYFCGPGCNRAFQKEPEAYLSGDKKLDMEE